MIRDYLEQALHGIRDYQRDCPQHGAYSKALEAVCETMETFLRYHFTIPDASVDTERKELLEAIGNLDLSAITVARERFFLALGCLYRSPTLDVEAMAVALAELIRHHAADERLRWCDDGRVRIMIQKVLPFRSAGQRKRFRVALNECLASMGWKEDKPGLWARV